MSSQTPRRRMRLLAACHLHKIKCSGNRPCQSCVSSNEAGNCQFPAKERKVTVPESKRLERLTQQNPTPVSQRATPSIDNEDNSPVLSPEESNMLNPLFDGQPENLVHERASQPGFIGEASCAAFSNRLLQCLDDTYTPSTAGFSNYYRVDFDIRVGIDQRNDLPERMHAKLLLNVARRFIGNYHPLFLEVSFMREIDAVYRREVSPSTLWMCKFYALMALGEIYTNRRGVGDNRVPGTDYYVRAVNMLREAYEEPSLLQVEVLTLLAWSSNILGRVRTAFCYIGTAMRLATSMGMHRSASNLTTLTPVERECRRRTWWVLYFFERFSASKLGQPVTLRDDDIDVELPSMEGLTEEERAEFLDPLPIVTNIKLARIIGNILTDIYGIPKSTSGLCIHRVHGILKQLREWHDALPPGMRVNENGTPRTVASLHLAYNQCIIQTTRPVLLYLFKAQFQLGHKKTASPSEQKQSFSSITLALAESCIHAAQASSRIAESLFLNGALATFGYWDAHHFFSAALILIMSAVMNPAVTTSDALETLLSILRSIKKDGNVPSVDFCERLSHIQARVASLRVMGQAEGELPVRATINEGRMNPGGPASATPNAIEADNMQSFQMTMGTHNRAGADGPSINYGTLDILGNHLIGSFLDDSRGPWPDALFSEDGTLKEFPSEIEEPFLFHTQY
ncbi:fungal-specific transcription factor domain-containing protein [Mariannaea sp. PMI_226]|nr:fungal-specific transcription factor domain-containing protein [Mariannaea sp. PMI_226]